MVGAVFAVIAVILGFLGQAEDGLGWDHLLRAWVLGMMLTFGFAVGGLALLMVQYCSGGKWGLLLRRPLEAMSRTLPLVFVYWLVVAHLHEEALPVGAITPRRATPRRRSRTACITEIQAALHRLQAAHAESGHVLAGSACSASPSGASTRGGSTRWPSSATPIRRSNTPYWIKKFENISGPGIVIYAITMTAAAIYWVMSMDPTWYSSVYGLLFLVGQGYPVLAFSIIVAISLSKAEPFKTILRQTEQHDLGKLTFAFVMLNIYLAFGQFLIIWSGNLPDEIPWYLDRIRGSWGIIITLDFIFHWLIPFTLLLSRDLKRNKKRLRARLPVDGLRPRLRSVLAHRAELQRRGAQPALQLGNSRVRCRAGGDVLPSGWPSSAPA